MGPSLQKIIESYDADAPVEEAWTIGGSGGLSIHLLGGYVISRRWITGPRDPSAAHALKRWIRSG
jgi:hypothetical protein